MATENLENEREVAEKVLAAKAGDQNSFELLVTKYKPLLNSLVNRYAEAGIDREDLFQEALLSFYQAVLRYDAKNPTATFGQYAKVCMRNGLVSYLRTQNPSSLTLPLGEEETEPENPVGEIIAKEDFATLNRRICEALSESENRIWLLYLAGRTAKEIATIVGKNEKSVQNAVFRIRKKLRTVIPNP